MRKPELAAQALSGQSRTTFLESFIGELVSSMSNDFDDNFDVHRFGARSGGYKRLSLRKKIGKLLHRRGWVSASGMRAVLLSALRPVVERLEAFEQLYASIGDEQSKKLLVRVMAFRALGHHKVRLPLNCPEYWKGIERIEGIADYGSTLSAHFNNWQLPCLDLQRLGLPFRLYALPKAAYIQLMVQPYRYHSTIGQIGVQQGDVVIDGGGCWGETALNFAHLAGENGHVYSFEFVPNNLRVFRENLALNAELASRTTIVEQPMWSETGTRFYYQDRGPATRVELEPFDGQNGDVSSLSIDALVERERLERVDFIKMDIEGAEIPALRGAANTLERFRPKLAISIYHSLDDMVNIPELIRELDLGYSYFIGHNSIHAEETVLFCKVCDERVN